MNVNVVVFHAMITRTGTIPRFERSVLVTLPAATRLGIPAPPLSGRLCGARLYSRVNFLWLLGDGRIGPSCLGGASLRY